MRYQRSFIIAIISLVILFSIGVAGYRIIEAENPHQKWTVFDAIFMTVITLTTVGYTDDNMSKVGRAFTVFLLIGGFGIFVYSIGVATAFIIEGQFREVFRRRKMEKSIN